MAFYDTACSFREHKLVFNFFRRSKKKIEMRIFLPLMVLRPVMAALK